MYIEETQASSMVIKLGNQDAKSYNIYFSVIAYVLI